MDWKGIGEKIIVAVMAGAILGGLGWIASYFVAPNPQTVKAQTDWVDVKNPLYLNDDPKKIDALDATGLSVFGVKIFGRILSAFRNDPILRIGSVRFNNDTNARTKEIEFSVSGGVGASTADQDQSGLLRRDIKLKPIEPHGSIEAYYLAAPWYSFSRPSISAIHDARAVEIDTKQLPDYLPFYSNAVTGYPVLVFIFFAIGAMILAILLIAGGAFLFVKDKIRYQAKNLTPKQIENQIKILDYVREHFPEKLPKTLQ